MKMLMWILTAVAIAASQTQPNGAPNGIPSVSRNSTAMRHVKHSATRKRRQVRQMISISRGSLVTENNLRPLSGLYLSLVDYLQ
jgi:hypothetical protein